MAEYTKEGFVALIMNLKKNESTVVKWNIHSDYSACDDDFPDGKSCKIGYSVILPDHVLVVQEDEWDGKEMIRLYYAGHEGFVPRIYKDEGEYEAVKTALNSLATETHNVSICGKRSYETLCGPEGVFMKVMDDNVRYWIDDKEVLHEVKLPYTEEFFNGEHNVSTCLIGNFADLCCEQPLGMLEAVKNSLVFANASELEEAVVATS